MLRRAQARLPPVVWLFGLASLLNDASSEAIFPLLGLFIAGLGAPMSSVGLVLGLADASAVAVKIAVGRLSDRMARRPLVIGGYLVAAAGRAAIAMAATPWQVLAARSLDRAGKAIRSGPRDAMLADAVPAGDRGRAFGVNQALDHLGAALGPLIASGCLAGGLSLRATFGVAASLGVLGPLLLGARLREVPRGGLSGPVAPSVPKEGERPRSGRPLARYLSACGLFALGNSSDAFILLRASELGWGASSLPLLWLAHHLVKAATTTFGGSLSDRVPRVLLIASGWGAFAVSYLGFALATERWQVLALLLFYAAYHGLAEAPERALVAELAADGRRGRAFGLYHGVVGFAALPAGLLTGWLWDRAGAPVAFGACAALAALATGALTALALLGRLRSGHHEIPNRP